LDQGLSLVKELGYAGISWVEKAPSAVKSDLAAIEKRGLKMFAIYCPAKVTPDEDHQQRGSKQEPLHAAARSAR